MQQQPSTPPPRGALPRSLGTRRRLVLGLARSARRLELALEALCERRLRLDRRLERLLVGERARSIGDARRERRGLGARAPRVVVARGEFGARALERGGELAAARLGALELLLAVREDVGLIVCVARGSVVGIACVVLKGDLQDRLPSAATAANPSLPSLPAPPSSNPSLLQLSHVVARRAREPRPKALDVGEQGAVLAARLLEAVGEQRQGELLVLLGALERRELGAQALPAGLFVRCVSVCGGVWVCVAPLRRD